MQCPMFVNFAEIQHTNIPNEGEMITLRFFFREATIQNREALQRPNPLLIPGPAVIMPKAVASYFLKKFLGFIAKNEEGGVREDTLDR